MQKSKVKWYGIETSSNKGGPVPARYISERIVRKEYAAEIAMLDASDLNENKQAVIEGVGTKEEFSNAIFYWLDSHINEK